jgi:hypothetical protein
LFNRFNKSSEFENFFGHNFGTVQDIDMIQTPISFFFQSLSFS